jgi:hypothetical protein
MNYELKEPIENTDIVKFTKIRRIGRLGHVMWMDVKRTPKRILEWESTGTRIMGRQSKRWIANIEEDVQIMGVRRWTKQCQERAEGKRITEKATNPLWVVMPVKEEEDVSSLQAVWQVETCVRY